MANRIQPGGFVDVSGLARNNPSFLTGFGQNEFLGNNTNPETPSNSFNSSVMPGAYIGKWFKVSDSSGQLKKRDLSLEYELLWTLDDGSTYRFADNTWDWKCDASWSDRFLLKDVVGVSNLYIRLTTDTARGLYLGGYITREEYQKFSIGIKQPKNSQDVIQSTTKNVAITFGAIATIAVIGAIIYYFPKRG